MAKKEEVDKSVLEFRSTKREKLSQLENDKLRFNAKLQDLEDEIEKFPDFAEAVKAKSAAEMTEAIKAGKDLATFKSKAAKEFQKKKEEIERAKDETEEALFAIAIAMEDIELEALQEELEILKKAQREYHEELEAAEKEFCARWDFLKINRVTADGNFAYEIDLRIEGLQTRHAQLNHLKRDRAAKIEARRRKRELLASGWDEREFFRDKRYGPTVYPAIGKGK